MNTLNPRSKYLHILAAFAACGLSVLADETWRGSTDNQWNVAGNWSGNLLPGAGEAAVFNNLAAANRGTVLGQDFGIGSIVLSNVPGAVSVGGANTLTLTPPAPASGLPIGINMSNAVQSLTITAPMSLANTQLWGVASGQLLDVSGAISGTGGIYKDAPGTLTLEGANSFTGNFTNNGGPVWVNNSSALGVGPKTTYIANNLVGAGLHLNGTNGNISLANNVNFILSQNAGAVFNEAGDNVIGGPISVFSGGGFAYVLANAGTLTLNGNITLGTTPRAIQVGGVANGTINGAINGGGFPFTKTDSGTWTLTAHNGYSGTTTVQGGTLVLSTNATINNTTNISILSNAVFDASQVFNTTFNANAFYLTPGATVQTLAGNGSVLGNVFAASTAFLVPGGPNVVGTLSFSNNLSLGNMTYSFKFNTATIPGAGVNDLVNVTGDIDPGSSALFVTALSPLTSPGTYRLFNYGGAKLNSFAGVPVQTDTRYTFAIDDVTTAGQVNLTVNGPSGNLTWNGGAGSSWNLYPLGNQTWVFNANPDYFYNGDPVIFDDNGVNPAVSINGTVRPSSVTVNNNSVAYTFSGSGKITGLTGITKTGPGTLTLTAGNCDFTGPVTVNEGVVSVSTLANIGSPSTLGAANTLVLNGGIFQFTGVANRTWNRFVSLGSAGGTVDSSVSSGGNFLFLTNTISGTGSLTKIGPKQLIIGESTGAVGGSSIAGSNTYSGNTFINQGEIQMRNAHALGFGKAVVASGTDLAFGGGANYGTMTNNIDLTGDGPSPFSGALQVNDTGTTATFSGTINLLANSSIGCQSLPGSFTISGPIIGASQLTKQNHVNCTVILTCPTNSYSGGTVVVGGTLQLGNGAFCGGLGSGPVANSGTLAYNHSDSFTNNSVISGTGNLTHTGTGTLTLGGGNTYSGATTVNGGGLVVNGTLAGGAVTVANGGTLGGYGTIAGPVSISPGGTLALGASIGTLTINNVLNLGGTNIMKVSHTTNDVIQGITTLSFGGALNISVVGSLQAGDTFKLFKAATYGATTFSSTNLPSLGGTLAWDASGLTNGMLKVISTGVTQPILNPPFRLGNGSIQLTFSGPSGSNYRVWATTNLAFKPITTAWSNLTSGTLSGVPVTFTDSQAPTYSRRFYVITIP